MHKGPDQTVRYLGAYSPKATIPLEQSPFINKNGFDVVTAGQILNGTGHKGLQGYSETRFGEILAYGGDSILFQGFDVSKCSVPEEANWVNRRFKDSNIAELCREEAILTYLFMRERDRLVPPVYDSRYGGQIPTPFPNRSRLNISTVKNPAGGELLFGYIQMDHLGLPITKALPKYLELIRKKKGKR